MQYKLIEKSIPGNPAAQKRWYASFVNTGTIKHYRLCKEIAERTKLTTADVTNVLDQYLEMTSAYLLQGNSVNMKNFANRRLSLTSQGAHSPREFTPNHIKQQKIVITPTVEFKRKLKKTGRNRQIVETHERASLLG